MTFKHGKNAQVFLNAYNMGSYLTGVDLAVDIDTADTTTFGATWKSSIAGVAGAKIDFSGLYEPTASGGFVAALGAAGVLTVMPSGGAVGDLARMASSLGTAYSESVPVGGVVAIKGSFDVSNGVAFGNVMHEYGDLAAPSATEYGADRDDAAPTSTGWTAHIHVTAVTGGSWALLFQDAATNDWASLADSSFTAITGATTQRLVGLTATATVRRHIRFVAVRTGGTGTDTISFILAFARK